MLGSIVGLLILALDIWAIVNIVRSGEKTANKALWIVLVLVLPVVGLAIWYFIGPKSG